MDDSVITSSVRMLVLDDDPQRIVSLRSRFPKASLVWVETVPECIRELEREWDVVRLDHDLGMEVFVDSNRSDCGMEVVRYIVANQPKHLKDTLFMVHTRNEAAGIAMVEQLTTAGYESRYHPFTWTV